MGPIRRGEGSVAWASLHPEDISQPRLLPSNALTLSPDEAPVMGISPIPMLAPLAHVVTPGRVRVEVERHYQSAPPNLGGLPLPDFRLVDSPRLAVSLDGYEDRRSASRDPFVLDEEAPRRAMKLRFERIAALGRHDIASDTKGKSKEVIVSADKGHDADLDPSHTLVPDWGECFKIQWLERRKLPFHRTRHLRNSWNQGREIKISRDGTELETNVGMQVLKEWDALVGEAQASF